MANKYIPADVEKWTSEYNGLLTTVIKYLDNYLKESKTSLPQYDIDFCEHYSQMLGSIQEDIYTFKELDDYEKSCNLLRNVITEIGARSYYISNLIEVLDPSSSTYGLMTGVRTILNLADKIEVKYFL